MQLDRRELVGLGGALLAAAGLPGPARAAMSGPARRLRKSCKIGMVQVEGSLEDKFKLLVELGFDGIELDSPNDLDDDVVLAAKEASGIEIPGVVDSVHWRQTLGDPDPEVRAHGRAGLLTALRDAKTYGSTTVLLVPAVVNANIAYDQAYSRSQMEIRRVLPLAEELGVSIALENVWNSFLLSPLEAARYVDEFESERVGWYMDVGNIVNYGWPEQWIRVLGHRVLKLDIKEFSRQKRDDEGLWKGFQVKLGEGDCNWPAVMQALEDVGYEGWASAEVSGGGRERLLEIRERMDRIFAG
jgi:hexulose-6-phosphate isomerase